MSLARCERRGCGFHEDRQHDDGADRAAMEVDAVAGMAKTAKRVTRRRCNFCSRNIVFACDSPESGQISIDRVMASSSH
jgi:hypothetical protein